MALMDNMVNDLKTEYTEAEHEEETAQKDYEDLMGASQKTRSSNAKSITEKESAKSEWTEKIENAKGEHASTAEALATLAEYISGRRADLFSVQDVYSGPASVLCRLAVAGRPRLAFALRLIVSAKRSKSRRVTL